ncbi:MAG: T9SS type A sorting domain-containing protein [Flavobacterium sp.]|nr:T9SS type A sorting domain-containing protein [Flavobacterium sp.]
MKKNYFLLVLCIMTISSFAQNLVENPTFASGVESWYATGTGYVLPTVISNDGQDDTSSVQYIATATTGFNQKFSVVPGATVTISYWYKAKRTDDGPTGSTGRIWSVFQATGSTTPINPPNTTGAANDPLRFNDGFLPQASTWTQKTVTSEVPVGANTFLLQFRAYNGATVSYDNISFESPGAAYLSTEGFNAISGLKVYPNPVSNGTLYIETAANAERTVTVFDVLGKQVLNTTTNNNAVSVNALRTGVYVVKINEEGKTVTRKLVIK